jgi:hypothetical protein
MIMDGAWMVTVVNFSRCFGNIVLRVVPVLFFQALTVSATSTLSSSSVRLSSSALPECNVGRKLRFERDLFASYPPLGS